MSSYYKYIGLTLGMLVLGFFAWPTFFQISSDLLDPGQTLIDYGTLPVHDGKIFAIAIGAIPILSFISNKISGINSIYHTIISIVGIVLFGILFWQVRVSMVNHQLQKLSAISDLSEIGTLYNRTDLQFELFFAIGLLCGTVMTGILQKILIKNNSKRTPVSL